MVSLRSHSTSALSSLAFWLVGLAACLLLSTGCASDEKGPAHTALPRDAVDQETASFLIQSQQALQQGALRAARTLADSVVDRAPRLPDAHFQRGRVLSELKQFDDAEQAYRDVLALAPDYRGVWYNMGNNAYRQQNYQQAVTFYRKAQSRYPSAQTLVSLGWTYVAQNKIDSARAAYENALSMDSSYALAHARLGQLHEDQGHLEQALEHSQRALDLNPDNGKYQYVVGSLLLRLDRPKAAVQHLRQATEAQPWHQGAHFSLGQALMRLGQEQDAQRYLAKADTLEQQQSEIDRLRSTARNNADNPTVWKTLGEKLRDAGQLEEAQQAFSVALYITPEDPILRNNLAMLASERGNHTAALGHFQALLNQHPSFVEGWFNLGVVYARLGRPQRAQRAWQEVLRRQPNHQQAKAYLARISADAS